MNGRMGILLAIAVALLAVYLYLPTIDGDVGLEDGYVHDAYFHNSLPDSPDFGVFLQSLDPSSRRKLTQTTVAWNNDYHYLGPRPYHLVNLLLHLIAVITVYGFLRELLRLAGREDETATRVALVAASLFAFSPIHTQVVNYVWQRATLMAAVFSLASLWFFAAGLRAGRWKIAVGLLLVPLAVLSKENAAMVLPIMFGLVLMFRPPKTPVGITWMLVGGTGLLVVGWYAASAYWWEGAPFAEVLAEGYEARDFTLGERLLTQPRVVLSLLSLILVPLPSRLSFDHDVTVSADLFTPWSTFPSHLALLLVVLVALVMAARRPLLSFGILWYLVMLVPESTVFPLELMSEHRAYLPSVGIFLLIALGLDAVYRRRRPVAMGLTVTLVLVLAFLTFDRNEVWTSRLKLWEDVTAKSPENSRAHYLLGEAVRGNRISGLSDAEFLRARHAFARALELDPREAYASALCNVHWGHLSAELPTEFLDDLERIRVAGQSKVAEYTMLAMQTRYPGDPRLDYAWARILASDGKVAEAISALTFAIEGGFSDRERLEWDPALKSVRSDPRFHALMEKLK